MHEMRSYNFVTVPNSVGYTSIVTSNHSDALKDAHADDGGQKRTQLKGFHAVCGLPIITLTLELLL